MPQSAGSAAVIARRRRSERMDRMGQASSHSTGQRQRKLADAVGKLARAELRKAKQKAAEAAGTKVARRRKQAF